MPRSLSRFETSCADAQLGATRHAHISVTSVICLTLAFAVLMYPAFAPRRVTRATAGGVEILR